MSRSALWRQEGNVKQRERQADEAFQNALEEGKIRDGNKGVISCCTRVTDTGGGAAGGELFGMNPMLVGNIAKSPYFQQLLREIHDWSALVDEIYYKVQNAEPWMSDSPYIRCIGFLYLRYATNPRELYGWFQPFLYDEEEVTISTKAPKGARKGSANGVMKMGEFVRELLTNLNYYGTRLPRLPVAVERDIQANLQLEEEKEERAKRHMLTPSSSTTTSSAAAAKSSTQPNVEVFCEGMQIRALYGDEENPVAWYPCIIDRVILRNEETGALLARPKYKVTFTEYGNTEIVTLGDIDFLEGSHAATDVPSSNVNNSHRYNNGHRSYSRSRSNDRSFGDRHRGSDHHDYHHRPERDRDPQYRDSERDRYGQEHYRSGRKVDGDRRDINYRSRSPRGDYHQSRRHTSGSNADHRKRGYGDDQNRGYGSQREGHNAQQSQNASSSTNKEIASTGSVEKPKRNLEEAAAKKQKLLSRYG